MIVDTSALVAIARKEADYVQLMNTLAEAPIARMSAGTLLELNAVAVRGRVFSIEWIDHALRLFGLTIEPVTREQALIGQIAYRRFGLGTQHPARLNFGDSFAYALAKDMGEPLLFKGDDFTHTDILSAI